MISEFKLLRFFQVMMDTRSLTETALRMGMHQGAANRALERLREMSGDALFMKTSKGMTPTAYAEGLRHRVHEVLPHIDKLFVEESFCPGETTRAFNIFSSDNGMMMVLSEVLNTFCEQAPKATINIAPINEFFLKRLQDGEMDLAILSNVQPRKFNFPPDFHEAFLMENDLVYVVSRHHPLAEYASKGQKVPLDEIGRYRRIEGSNLMVPKHSELFSEPIEQGVPLYMPHYLAAALILESTPLTLVLPRSTAERLCRQTAIVMLETEPASYTLQTKLVWHHRAHHDPALAWLRDLFVKQLRKKQVK